MLFARLQTELKQAQSPFHSISPEVFLKIAKNLNVASVAKLRKTCRLFSYWGNLPQYWEAIFTHYCDSLPEEEWYAAVEADLKLSFRDICETIRLTQFDFTHTGAFAASLSSGTALLRCLDLRWPDLRPLESC